MELRYRLIEYYEEKKKFFGGTEKKFLKIEKVLQYKPTKNSEWIDVPVEYDLEQREVITVNQGL
jgi:hypothetical protein